MCRTWSRRWVTDHVNAEPAETAAKRVAKTTEITEITEKNS
jgi:hypothetical protein